MSAEKRGFIVRVFVCKVYVPDATLPLRWAHHHSCILLQMASLGLPVCRPPEFMEHQL
jgi:hypothetical protein